MARGILRKMVRGAAEAGVPMLMEQHRAQIQAQRDKKLQELAQANRKEDRQFQIEDREDQQAHDKELYSIKEKNKDRPDDYKVPEYEKYFNARAEKAFGKEYEGGIFYDSDEARYNAASTGAKARQIFLQNPGEGENAAWEKAMAEFKGATDDKKSLSKAESEAKKLAEERKSIIPFMSEGFEGLSEEDWKKREAQKIYSKNKPAITINSQEEYDKLPSGAIYIDAQDGKRYRKP